MTPEAMGKHEWMKAGNEEIDSDKLPDTHLQVVFFVFTV